MSPSSSANRPCPRADRLASRTDIQHCRSTPQSSAAHRNSPTPERPMAPSDPVSVPEYRTLLLTRQGRRLTITLNRPELRNACNYAMHEELADVFQSALTDSPSDVIVVTGAGRAFSPVGSRKREQ